MKHLVLFLTILLMTQTGFAQTVGSMAPDFTLKNTSDQTFTLSDYKGKVVAVFMLGYACPSCKGIAPSVQSKLIDKFKENPNFVFVGIDTWDGTTAQVESFNTATGTSFNILQKGSAVAQSWQTSYDRMIVIDSKGNIAFKGEGLVSTHLDQAISAVSTELNKTTTSVLERSNSSNSEIDIFPNPVINRATVLFQLKEPTEVSYSIFDLTGKTVQKKTNRFEKGENSIPIDATGFSKGIHFIQIRFNNELKTKKFIVN